MTAQQGVYWILLIFKKKIQTNWVLDADSRAI